MRFVGLSALAMTAILSASSFGVFSEPADAATICPAIFMPVCAVKHGVRQNFGNSCEARRAHARVLHAGDCVAPSGNICFKIFAPVCAINPHTGKRQTFGNLCDAEVADATVVSEGACH
jgi:hypothetical protein